MIIIKKWKKEKDPGSSFAKNKNKQKKPHEFDAESSGAQCIKKGTHCIKKVYNKDSRDIFTLITF